ncbi:hypothetical protein, partial [Mesorhizobium sp. M7A.F.Ca.US.014.04.1.1]|uniref:hypothetical protein n=1 Tax=Mesorhizobium sp. M7A.F.Ca.US.014.04.1.1 TaxID=2496744 RepID=UPI0019D07A73
TRQDRELGIGRSALEPTTFRAAGDQRDLRSRSLSLLASEVVSRVQFYANWLLFAGMQLKGHQLRCRSALWQQ